MKPWAYMLVALATTLHPAAGQSVRPGWGAVPYAGIGGTGVTFRTWAPNASTVTVAGEFNGWNTGSLPLANEGGGVWSRDVAGATVGQRYKFVINGNLWRRDPYSRQLEGDGTRNSIIPDPAAFDWGTNVFVMPPPEALVIYEMHIGTFFDPVPGDSRRGTFSNAILKLDHLADLGINAVELMPISDFPTPTSWGYNLSYPFAIESQYGTPDEARAFVKACHDRGIAVLMDIVHNHWGSDGNDWSLWQYDGWSSNGLGGIFFYNDPVYADTGWGPRPDYSRSEVRSYIQDNFRMWKDEFRIDGFRWDAPKYILYTDGTQAVPVPDGSNLINEVISMLSTQYPGTFNIAEDIKGVAGFDSHWDLDFQWRIQDFMAQASDASRNLFTLATILGADARRIVFTESHDTTGDLNNGRRFPVVIDGNDPEGYWARKRTMLAAALTLTAPGTPMIWQGQELYETNTFSDGRALDWSRTNSFSRVGKLFRDLVHLRRNLDGVSAGLMGDGMTVSLINNSEKIMVYQRYRAADPDDKVVVVANCTSTPRTDYQIQLPSTGTWYVHVNTDDTTYGADFDGMGDVVVTATGSPAVARIDLGRYSAQVMSRIPASGLAAEAWIVSDQTGGNGNGIAEPGETIEIGLVLHNVGQAMATNISAVLAGVPAGIAVLQPIIDFADLPPEGVATGQAAFVLEIPTGWSCGTALDLQVELAHDGSLDAINHGLEVGLRAVVNAVTGRYESADLPVDILDHQTAMSGLVVNHPATGGIVQVSAWVRLDHTWVGDLVISLVHPDGTSVLLANHRGSFRNNYGTGDCGGDVVYTVFDDDAVSSIAVGTAPFADRYQPEAPMSLFDGKPASGSWALTVQDTFSGDTGTLLCWGLDILTAEELNQCQTFFGEHPDSDGDGLPDWWEALHGGGITNMIAEGDADMDGITNADEFRAGTNPTNGASFLHVDRVETRSASNLVIRWASESNRLYRLSRSATLDDPAFTVIRSNLPATPAWNVCTDTVDEASMNVYRIEVE